MGTVIAAVVFSLGPWGCSFLPFNTNGGSGADVETRVQGSAVDSSGKPVAGASVLLRPSGYVFPIPGSPSDSSGKRIDAFTDNAGKFRIDSLGPGSYVIEGICAKDAVVSP